MGADEQVVALETTELHPKESQTKKTTDKNGREECSFLRLMHWKPSFAHSSPDVMAYRREDAGIGFEQDLSEGGAGRPWKG